MKMQVPDAFIELPVPDRLRKLIPDKYGIECFKPTPDYGPGTMMCVTYGATMESFVHSDAMLAENVFWAGDRQIKRAIINPILRGLQERIEKRRRELSKAQAPAPAEMTAPA